MLFRSLESLPLQCNSDDFVFDNEMIAQVMYKGFRIGEISCPTKYFEEASSINFRRSVTYGFGVLWTAMRYRLQKWGLAQFDFLTSPVATSGVRGAPGEYYSEVNPTGAR
mgnify:CR=1 FL=1